jgi:hypothetical protein
LQQGVMFDIIYAKFFLRMLFSIYWRASHYYY